VERNLIMVEIRTGLLLVIRILEKWIQNCAGATDQPPTASIATQATSEDHA